MSNFMDIVANPGHAHLRTMQGRHTCQTRLALPPPMRAATGGGHGDWFCHGWQAVAHLNVNVKRRRKHRPSNLNESYPRSP